MFGYFLRCFPFETTNAQCKPLLSSWWTSDILIMSLLSGCLSATSLSSLNSHLTATEKTPNFSGTQTVCPAQHCHPISTAVTHWEHPAPEGLQRMAPPNSVFKPKHCTNSQTNTNHSPTHKHPACQHTGLSMTAGRCCLPASHLTCTGEPFTATPQLSLSYFWVISYPKASQSNTEPPPFVPERHDGAIINSISKRSRRVATIYSLFLSYSNIAAGVSVTAIMLLFWVFLQSDLNLTTKFLSFNQFSSSPKEKETEDLSTEKTENHSQ